MKFYPYAVCIDFRRLLFMSVRTKVGVGGAHFLLGAGSGSLGNDKLAQDGELLKVRCRGGLLLSSVI